MLDWSLLCKLGVGSTVDALEGGIALEDGVYKISDSKYLLADIFFEDGKEKIKLLSIFWACSEPAFRRAYFRDVENDDMAKCLPPVELLPSGSGMSYGSIRKVLSSLESDQFLEYASYRVMSDGAFVHKSLEGRKAIYYFRSSDIIEDELPYAILWK